MTKFSKYFLPTLKEDPADAVVPSHKLMLRSGMIRRLASGVYNWLPFGYAVLKNVEHIVREEMNRSGALELFMPMVQPGDLWKEGDRWDKYDDGQLLAKFKDRHGNDYCLGPTHELVITDIFRQNIQSYRELPLMLYQIQTKFRDEFRPQYGTIRPREFLMKDCYSFDIDKEHSIKSYEIMLEAYHRIFQRIGVEYACVAADPGAIGAEHSHEFHVLANTGLDELLFDPDSDYAVNIEKYNPETCPVSEDKLIRRRGIEVGHCYHLGTAYSSSLQAEIALADGKSQTVVMGCYGIGVSRLVGSIIEQFHDDKGIVWPESIAPYNAIILNLRVDDGSCSEESEKIYRQLSDAGLKVLLDDRDKSAGAKLKEADLIGITWQIIIGPKNLAEGKLELKERKTGIVKTLTTNQIKAFCMERASGTP